MPVVQFGISSTTPIVWGQDELREMFKIGDNDELIPFISKILLFSNTADRNLTVEIDPFRRYTRKNPPVNIDSAGSNEGHRSYFKNRWLIAVAADLSPLIIPIEVAIRWSLAMELSAGAVFSVHLYYVLIKGQFIPDTEILERLADRRRMDRHDTDDPTQGQFRMGKLRKMGSAT